MTAKKIESRQNSKIKQIRGLKQRKQRVASGLFVVEGQHHIGEALAAKAKLEYVVYSAEMLVNDFGKHLFEKIELADIACYETSPEILEGLSEKENPPDLLAVAVQTEASLAELTFDDGTRIVAIVEPQDPGNLGTIMRTIDSVGAAAMVIIGNGVDIYHPKAVRASMGSLFWHPVVRTNFAEFANWTNQMNIHVYGTTAKNGEPVSGNLAILHPSVLLLGSEREGLSQLHLDICERVFKIPMHGRTTSLNLAVAAGIMMYAMRPE